MKAILGTRSLLVPIGLIIATILAKAAHGDVVVSNLNRPFLDSTPVGNPEFWGAQSFFSGGEYTLNSIDFQAGNAFNSPLIVAELRRSTANQEIDLSAAGLLTTFTVPDLSGAPAIHTLIPDSAVTLNGGERYWWLMGVSNNGGFDWDYAADNLSTGPGLIGNYADSADAGATWIYRDDSHPYLFQVNGFAAVPEPSAYLLLAGAGAVAWAGSRFRARAAAK